MFILWTLEQSRVVGGLHLERGLGGDGRGTAAASGPGVRVQELTGVVRAVAEARPVEALVGSVHFLSRVALHEQVDRHHPRSLAVSKHTHTHTQIQANWASTQYG